MSYDIRFGVKVAGAQEECYAVIGHPEYDNPTYNLRDIFVKSMGWDYHQGEWYKVSDILPKVQNGITELTLHSEKYKPLEPSNGWGTISSAIECLKSIVDYFGDNWNGLGGSWNADIPIDCIYMCW